MVTTTPNCHGLALPPLVAKLTLTAFGTNMGRLPNSVVCVIGKVPHWTIYRHLKLHTEGHGTLSPSYRHPCYQRPFFL